MPEVYQTFEEGEIVLNKVWNEEKFFCECGAFVVGRIYDYEYEIILN